MSPVVYKYPLRSMDDTINVPDGAVVLVGRDASNSVCVWIQHADRNGLRRDRRVYIAGTGHDIPQPANHLGSFVDGQYVWHIYSPDLERHP